MNYNNQWFDYAKQFNQNALTEYGMGLMTIMMQSTQAITELNQKLMSNNYLMQSSTLPNSASQFSMSDAFRNNCNQQANAFSDNYSQNMQQLMDSMFQKFSESSNLANTMAHLTQRIMGLKSVN